MFCLYCSKNNFPHNSTKSRFFTDASTLLILIIRWLCWWWWWLHFHLAALNLAATTAFHLATTTTAPVPSQLFHVLTFQRVSRTYTHRCSFHFSPEFHEWLDNSFLCQPFFLLVLFRELSHDVLCPGKKFFFFVLMLLVSTRRAQKAGRENGVCLKSKSDYLAMKIYETV